MAQYSGALQLANGASVNAGSGFTWFANTVSVNGTVNLLGTNRLNTTIKTLELNSGTRTFNVNGKSIAVTGNSVASEGSGLSQWEMTVNTILGTPVIQNGVWDLETTTFSGSNYGAMRINNATNFSNADLIIGQNDMLLAANTNTLGSNANTSPNVTVNGILNLVACTQSGRTVNVKSLTGTGRFTPACAPRIPTTAPSTFLERMEATRSTAP